MERVAASPGDPMNAGTQIGDGSQKFRPEIVNRGKPDQAFDFCSAWIRVCEDFLATALNRKALAFDYRLVFLKKHPELKILSFHHPLNAVGLVTEQRIVNTVANEQVVFERN